jgi:hypothetical protein
VSLVDWLLGKPSESKFYKIALIDDAGRVIKKKQYRIYQDLKINEYQAQALGRELARDAMHNAGWWNQKANK